MAVPTAVSNEHRALVTAALAVLRRTGADGLTVADVLDEAGLSTRAFYRHFTSKDELLLALYARDSTATEARVRERLASAPSPRAAIECWIDETLALGFEPRRAARTRVFAREGARLQLQFPQEFANIMARLVGPLAEVLARVGCAEPERDARSVHAVAWALVEDKLHGAAITRAEARAHVLRFCFPALGMAP